MSDRLHRNTRDNTRILSDIGRYGIVPLWLIEKGASPLAVKLFALLAAKYADRDTNNCHPSRRAIAQDLGLSAESRKRVDAVLDELVTIDALRIERRYDAASGDQTTNLYTLRFVMPIGGGDERPQGGGQKTPGEGRKLPNGGGQKTPGGRGQKSPQKEPESVQPESLNQKEILATDVAASDDVDFSCVIADDAPPVDGPLLKADALTVANLQRLWNEVVAPAGCPESRGMTAALEQQTKARIREASDWHTWQLRFAKIAGSKFLTGDNDRGWRATFAWTMKPANLLKIDEGAYATLRPKQDATPRPASVTHVPGPLTDDERAERDAARARREQGAKEREAEARAAIDAMPAIARDALMVAAGEELRGYEDRLSLDDYRAAVERKMVALIVEGARGRTIADAVAYFVSQRGGMMTA